ncbi:MAG: hypothetical protein INH41_19270 [Myxococcaceae bacterium]|nr:hypothetical protein [Myxococcaceae bacterium]
MFDDDDDNVIEVARAHVETFDGAAKEVSGGAYLTPEAVLRTTSELARLRARSAELDQVPRLVPLALIGAGLAGFAVGYWLGRKRR